MRAKDYTVRFDEFDRDGIRPSGICLQKIAGLEDQVGLHGRPAFVQHRLDADDALCIGHLADATIVDELLLKDELLIRSRLWRHGLSVGAKPASDDDSKNQQYSRAGGEPAKR